VMPVAPQLTLHTLALDAFAVQHSLRICDDQV